MQPTQRPFKLSDPIEKLRKEATKNGSNGLCEIKIDNGTDSDLCLYVFGKEAIASAKEFNKEWLKRHPPESHLVDAIDEHGKSVRKVKNYKDTGSEG